MQRHMSWKAPSHRLGGHGTGRTNIVGTGTVAALVNFAGVRKNGMIIRFVWREVKGQA